jgi:hypothetical protein
VERTRDPLALASAICKTATTGARGLVALSGRGHARRRVSYLMEEEPRRGSRSLELAARVLAGLLIALVLALAATPAMLLLAGDAAAEATTADCHHHDHGH